MISATFPSYEKKHLEVLGRSMAYVDEGQSDPMYELDNRKDQVMTVCKVAVANLAMWVRDRPLTLIGGAIG